MNEEIRSAVPIFSRLQMTILPGQQWVPTGNQTANGEEIYRKIPDLPGIDVEITPSIGNPGKLADPIPFRLPSRVFFEEQLAAAQALITRRDALVAKEAATPAEMTLPERQELASLQAQSSQLEGSIVTIQAVLATDAMWVEDVLATGGLPAFGELWTDIFSEVLDMFGSWQESGDVGGIPIKLRIMKWDAKLPPGGSKSIDLKIGIFSSDDRPPKVFMLSFEDAATRTTRLANEANREANIANLTAQLATANDATKAQLEQQIAMYQRDLDNSRAVERALLEDIFALPSVKTSLPSLLVAILSMLKLKVWPDLNMPYVTGLLAARLAELLPAE